MPRYKITIEYEGTNYSGWQKQESVASIAGEIEEAIKKFSGEEVVIYAAGRTDAGVHALGQVAHFDLITDKFSSYRIREALNYHLKDKQIVIIDCEEVCDDFHARFSATKRYYQYVILTRVARPTIDKNRVWHVRNQLDIGLMQLAANILVGEHDFSSFRAAECQAKSPIKTVDYIEIIKIDEKIVVSISARSFLHHMVRNIVGSLKLVGQQKMTLEEFAQGFEKRERKVMAPTAPASGLFLVKIDY